jgi:uncharacterized protein (UPF0264 family)
MDDVRCCGPSSVVVADGQPAGVRGDRPKLLVSVRSAVEALAALAGGCDILDVKEPARGSLGMANREVIAEILATSDAAGAPRVTAALGETRDWLGARRLPVVPPRVFAVKLGLAGLEPRRWMAAWRDVRRRIEEQSERPLAWIAVVYADDALAQSPPAEAVIEAAVATHCAGVLFDTFSKTGRNLLEWMELRHIERLARSIQSANLLVALAGSLSAEILPAVCGIRPDVIAVRGAASGNGSRTAAVSAAAVRSLRSVIDSTGSDPVDRQFSLHSVQTAERRRRSTR